MPKYEQLYHLELGPLRSAADRWQETAQKFTGLGTEFADRVDRPFRDAGWSEPAATAGQAEQQTQQAKQEYADAAAEAKAVYGVLNTLHEELKQAKTELHQVADVEAKKQGLRVDGKGTVTPLHDLSKDSGAIHDPDGPELIRKQQDQCDALAARLTRILQRAAEADETACWGLSRNLGGNKQDFNAKGLVTSLDSADAVRATDLAKKGAKMTDAELKQLDELLKNNRGDKEFAEKFAVEMKAKGTLQLWAELTGRPLEGGQLSQARQAILKNMQVDLSHTLALASQSDSKAMEAWKSDMLKLGPGHVPNHSNSSPNGFQVMSSLMRHGKYDDDFLADYGKQLISYEKKTAKEYGGLDQVWQAGIYGDRLNFGAENDAGGDPMTGFMQALGHNPAASADFFKQRDNFDYLVGGSDDPAREWPSDSIYGDKSKTLAGHDALGHALESATLGVPYDAPVPPLHRTKDGAEVMEQVVQVYGEHPELLHKRPGSEDSVAKMGAAYIDDLNNGMADFGTYRDGGMHPLYETKGQAHAAITRDQALDFIAVMGQTEDTHATMSQAQQAYSLGILESEYADPNKHPATAHRAVYAGAEVHGLLDNSRLDQIRADANDDMEKQKEELAKTGDWVKWGVGTVIGGGVSLVTGGTTAPVAIPIAAGVVGGALGTHINHEVDDAIKRFEIDKTDDIQEADKKYRRAGEANAVYPAKAYGEAHKLPLDSETTQKLVAAAQQGYADGKTHDTFTYKSDDE
ncbi:hypothetical protein [Streptomyces sp. NPDC003077]|uniref:hypothetical protein n=1 Tax=Streptomyces sp. NPDC003077 TaxID=3154443 RepID=UPI0033BC0D4D